MNKTCTACLQTKSLGEFHRDSRNKDGRTAQCAFCRAAKVKQYADANKHTSTWKERKRSINLKKNYGISLEQYEQLFAQQHGKCAICSTSLEKGDLDHCHITGTVRGILCPSCNKGLGFFKDDISVLKQAIKYLERG